MTILGTQKLPIDPSSAQLVSQDITTVKPKEKRKQEKEKKPKLTQERVKELFNYDPDAGNFTRRCDNTDPITKDKNGYNRIRVDRIIYSAGIVAWLYYYGCRPSSRLVHIDGNNSNLSITNLKIYAHKPKACRKEITSEVLNNLFLYDEVTGILYRKIDAKSTNGSVKCKAGSEVGYKSKSGYIIISIDKLHYQAHRVIWCMVYGYWPENVIDHANRQKSCNILSNLREVSQQCNTRNIPVQKNNSTGVSGVSKVVSKWGTKRVRYQAYIKVNYVKVSLGQYECFTEAVAHRLAAEQYLDYLNCNSTSSAFLYMQAYLRGEDMQKYLETLK